MSSSPFVFPVASLRRRHGAVQAFSAAGELGGLEVSGARVPSGAEVTAEGSMEALPGGLLVTAEVAAPWEGECRRCLEMVRGDIAVSVRELFDESPDATESDEDAYPLSGGQVDLAPMVRDAILLELPQAVLCAESCQGLCPTCGVNRNDGECSCPPTDRDPRWAALDALRDQTHD